MKIKLLQQLQVAEDTAAFSFERPAGFEFKAGQSGDFTLIDPPETDGEGNTRAFSLAGAPHEKNLMIATRMRNTAFKRVLKSLPIGSELSFEGPFGSMTLHNKADRAGVFLAGGIGITPFRSMVVRAAKEKLPHRLYLFYSNRHPAAAAFLDELTALERQNPAFKLISTIDNDQKPGVVWNGERGHIDRQMLTKYLGTLAGPVYYLAGPPAMVAAMQNMLNEAGVDDDDIRSEAFSGY